MTKVDRLKIMLKKRRDEIKAANKRAGIITPRVAPIAPVDPVREANLKRYNEERAARNRAHAASPAVVEAYRKEMEKAVKACDARIALVENLETTYGWLNSQVMEDTMGK